jgi:hypothetical protein
MFGKQALEHMYLFRLATTVAAVLPTALAAFTTARNCSAKSYDTSVDEESKEQFLKLVDLLLSDMKLFKQVEMIKKLYLFVTDSPYKCVSFSP